MLLALLTLAAACPRWCEEAINKANCNATNCRTCQYCLEGFVPRNCDQDDVTDAKKCGEATCPLTEPASCKCVWNGTLSEAKSEMPNLCMQTVQVEAGDTCSGDFTWNDEFGGWKNVRNCLIKRHIVVEIWNDADPPELTWQSTENDPPRIVWKITNRDEKDQATILSAAMCPPVSHWMPGAGLDEQEKFPCTDPFPDLDDPEPEKKGCRMLWTQLSDTRGNPYPQPKAYSTPVRWTCHQTTPRDSNACVWPLLGALLGLHW
jgi:hypothetical protein